MCGIAGIYAAHGSDAITPGRILSMMGAIRHRGPDEAGIYLDDRIGLGHVRLSIVDLPGGTQPISNEDRTVWIVYNGEVYNYPELRKELAERGHLFSTGSDTEVIVHLYEEKGAACVDDLNGQFAFAIWDSRAGELLLARDRFGVRPIHYVFRNGVFYFASEIKALFTCPEIEREIDPVSLEQVFTFWTTLPGRTVFSGVKELPAGCLLKISGGNPAVKRYWDMPISPAIEKREIPFEECVGEVRDILADAVRIRLRADVEVGTYVSGGLDSSGVTALARKYHEGPLKSFGIRFQEPGYDEGPQQRELAAYLGIDHQEIRVDNRLIDESLARTVWHCEKPILRTAPVPLMLLSGLVREQGVKVVLTGEGADEVFGGYNIFRETKARRFWAEHPESPYRPLLIRKLYPYLFADKRLGMLKRFFGRRLTETADPFYSHRLRWDSTSGTQFYFSERMREGVYDSYADLASLLPDSFAGGDWLDCAQYLEIMLFMSNYLLSSQGDRVAMAHSVEIRLPYLDHRLAEYLSNVPSRFKIRGMKEKWLLNRALAPLLPPSIVNRPKHPFRAPIIQGLLSDETRTRLAAPHLSGSGLFDPLRVGMLLHKIEQSRYPSEMDAMALAGIVTTQQLHEQFIEHFAPEPWQSANRLIVHDRRTVRKIEPEVYRDSRVASFGSA